MSLPNKFLQTDKVVLSCLLQKSQMPRQYAFAAEEKRYTEYPRAIGAANQWTLRQKKLR